MKRKGMKREQRAAIALIVRAAELVKAAKKRRFGKKYLVKPEHLNALGWAVRDLDPHVRRWVKKNGGKV